ncbi:hypothetical protein LIER_10950 [Lithospermum erythrorhizon]|uniref:Uncharacterized protein n=1 Tax=Lithospermum erythrorhizon TaxID=34254 RepID=A0AAV3PNJ4_LITER
MEVEEDAEVFAANVLTKPAAEVEGSSKESQTLEGFCRNMAETIIAKGHLRHLRDHYSIHQKVLMRTPFEGETPNAPQGEGYTPSSGSFLIMGCD